ncbi:mitochondrial type 2c protein phosphatase involved in regulation of pyruvate dehydrogenase activity [Moniliophthora roreri MCA 2997]|uniref:Mitochondrial type 2c protein phosphatase involved in regulation of pyruvate dehydrogenase activity n=2 Tax=Moniliophthora roreri TaxID=221103 RepID=V2WEJ4_MONRO|nr:mitochondrial type 2c protein phosphatase involved in regulation of pyruvate dehydrogenase activity [Moniliophthora roreri MCA 2997]KAI3615864.1 mitochondrial type 2c protein phosphatase [Moniliophthora roreri]
MTTMVQHAPSQAGLDWAYSEDIPGSRCGPDDGPWPRPYQILEEEDIWRELRFLAKPQTFHFDTSRGWRADSINFQPSPSTRTQDRYVVKQLEINGRQWSLTGVFDGHLGDVTVEHVSHHLPIIIQEFLQNAFENEPSRLSDPAFISQSFSRSITAFDKAIAGDVLNLFGGIEGLSNYTDAQIRQVINDQHRGGHNYTKARLNMYGTTALVALVDPDHNHLWIANVGDCKAILVSPMEGDDWEINVLTTDHNGDNDAEVERVRQQHPDEPECVVDRRVLGALAPFRALGDTPFKQPPEFTRRILFNLLPGFHDTSPWEEFLARNRTPPYISSEPEITHYPLSQRKHSRPGPRFLILSSDGFSDLCSSEGQHKIITDWARHVVQESRNDNPLTGLFNSMSSATTPESNINNILPTYPLSPTLPTAPGAGQASRNMALRLLRRALGGEDRLSVSKVLTLDMDAAWIDDTAIVVQTL